MTTTAPEKTTTPPAKPKVTAEPAPPEQVIPGQGAIPVAENTEKDAPWGRKSDGTPYARDPSRYLNRSSGGSRASGPSAPPKTKPSARKAASGQQDRMQRVMEFLSIPITVLGLAGQASNSKPLIADAIVLQSAAPTIAEAVAQVAADNDQVARIVDKLVQSGPYAALLGALVPVVMQLAANHATELPPIAASMGLGTADQVIAAAAQAQA